MTDEPTPAVQLAQRRPRPWLVPALIATATVALVALTAAVVIFNFRSDDTSSADTPPVGGTITVTGTVTLDDNFYWGLVAGDKGCFGRDGYDDLVGGASVVVTDASGTTVGVGQLRTGLAVVGSDNRASVCNMGFSVYNVPTGKGFYAIEVSRRGKVTFHEAELASPVQLAID